MSGFPSSSRMILYRSIRSTADPARRQELVRAFALDQLRCLVRQLEDPAEDLEPDAIAKALTDVAGVLRLPPAGVAISAPLEDPTDRSGMTDPAAPPNRELFDGLPDPPARSLGHWPP
jgi:hypothetical protein